MITAARMPYLSAVSLALLAVFGCQLGGRAPESVERVYEVHCIGCHGPKGEARWGSNIAGLQKSVKEIAAVIAAGSEKKMPAYRGHLSEAEIRQLADYVKAFKAGGR